VGSERITATSAPRICVEDALRLGAADLIRAARRQHPMLWERLGDGSWAALVPVLAPVTRGGMPAGEIGVVLTVDGLRAAAGFPGGDSAPLVVARTIRHLRWLWLCPRLGHPCTALFLPPGGDRFLSRQAHGLRHRSASESPMERAARKARKLRAKLGERSAVLGGSLPDRPVAMHARTYARVCEAIREAEGRTLTGSTRLLARIAADAG
jgi:hypothetical protein